VPPANNEQKVPRKIGRPTFLPFFDVQMREDQAGQFNSPFSSQNPSIFARISSITPRFSRAFTGELQ